MAEESGCESVAVFVLSHQQFRLDALGVHPNVHPINLNELSLTERLKGQDLAEARFFIADALDSSEAEWIALVSARWSEKWPLWPGISELPDVMSGLNDPAMVVAPATWWWPAHDVRAFADRQDRRYPGVGALLSDPQSPVVSALPHSRLNPLVFNNTFIAHRTVVRDWLAYFRSCFDYFDGRYGLDLPFEVQCAWCGLLLRNDDGERIPHPGRLYEPIRHAAYFYELITTTYFASRPDLLIVGANLEPARAPLGRSLLNSAYWRFDGARSTFQRIHGKCQPGFSRAS